MSSPRVMAVLIWLGRLSLLLTFTVGLTGAWAYRRPRNPLRIYATFNRPPPPPTMEGTALATQCGGLFQQNPVATIEPAEFENLILRAERFDPAVQRSDNYFLNFGQPVIDLSVRHQQNLDAWWVQVHKDYQHVLEQIRESIEHFKHQRGPLTEEDKSALRGTAQLSRSVLNQLQSNEYWLRYALWQNHSAQFVNQIYLTRLAEYKSVCSRTRRACAPTANMRENKLKHNQEELHSVHLWLTREIDGLYRDRSELERVANSVSEP